MFSTTLSAILRSAWLIDKAWADAHAHLVAKMIQGEAVDFGMAAEKLSGPEAKAHMPQRIRMMDDGSEVFQARPWHSADKFPYNSIVMIDIIGPVLKYGDVCSYGSVDYMAMISRFANAKNISGIILNIDSPGGQAAGTAMTAATIRKAVALKPVVGIVQDGIAASAAEWMFSACQECYVSEDTDSIGSIGAYVSLYDFKGWFEQQGIKEFTIYAPQSIHKNEDYRQVIDSDGKETSLVEEDLRFLVEDFKKDVTAFRGARLKTKGDEPFTGKMYSAADAKRIGLIDGIKPLDQVVKRVQNLISLRQQNSK